MFIHSLIKLQSKLKKPFHRIRIPQNTKTDLRYYYNWCSSFNDVVFYPSDTKPQPETTVYTDSSLEAGDAYWTNDFIYSSWESDFPHIKTQHIFVKELCAVLLAFRRWSHLWINRCIHVRTDNKGTEWAIRKGLTKNSVANDILREILWIAAVNNIAINVSYIRSKDNYMADALSRMHDIRFLAIAIKQLALTGLYISCPYYNLCHHMSWDSYCFMFSQRSDPWLSSHRGYASKPYFCWRPVTR